MKNWNFDLILKLWDITISSCNEIQVGFLEIGETTFSEILKYDIWDMHFGTII